MPPLWLIPVLYVLASVITFFAFSLDKRAAERGRPRTRERTLHLLEALGGFPGALLAMKLVRHKNRKFAYWVVTAIIALVHVAAWAWIGWSHFGPRATTP